MTVSKGNGDVEAVAGDVVYLVCGVMDAAHETTAPWMPRHWLVGGAGTAVEAQAVGISVITSAREVQALATVLYLLPPKHSQPCSTLQRLVMAPKEFLRTLPSCPSDSSPLIPPSNWSTFLWKHLHSSFNDSQLQAIVQVCGDVPPSPRTASRTWLEEKLFGLRLCLWQGPPGTGKVTGLFFPSIVTYYT